MLQQACLVQAEGFGEEPEGFGSVACAPLLAGFFGLHTSYACIQRMDIGRRPDMSEGAVCVWMTLTPPAMV